MVVEAGKDGVHQVRLPALSARERNTSASSLTSAVMYKGRGGGRAEFTALIEACIISLLGILRQGKSCPSRISCIARRHPLNLFRSSLANLAYERFSEGIQRHGQGVWGFAAAIAYLIPSKLVCAAGLQVGVLELVRNALLH